MGTFVVHIIIVVLLLWVGFTIPERSEESGVEVMLGSDGIAYGGFAPSSLVDVDIMSEPELPEASAEPAPSSEQSLLTQDLEETVALTPKAEPKKETPKKNEPTEAERKAAEAQRQAAAKAETERKAAAAAAQRVTDAFGKGTQIGSAGGQGTGTGTGSNPGTGTSTGTGGYGTFDLGGRSIGSGGLPRPAYNVQEEGRVVVSITVNPQGVVVATAINPLTNTVNSALRKAAEEAAAKARFNAVEGLTNQTGTITYYFNLR